MRNRLPSIVRRMPKYRRAQLHDSSLDAAADFAEEATVNLKAALDKARRHGNVLPVRRLEALYRQSLNIEAELRDAQQTLIDLS